MPQIAPGKTNFEIGLGWYVNESHESDCDVSVFMINNDLKLSAKGFFVFYNNLHSQDESIEYSGDCFLNENLDDEVVFLELNKVDNQISQMIFVLTIFRAEETNQNFSVIDNIYLRLVNRDTGDELFRYSAQNEFYEFDAIELGRFYQIDENWNFEVLGKGHNGGLLALLDVYV